MQLREEFEPEYFLDHLHLALPQSLNIVIFTLPCLPTSLLQLHIAQNVQVEDKQ